MRIAIFYLQIRQVAAPFRDQKHNACFDAKVRSYLNINKDLNAQSIHTLYKSFYCGRQNKMARVKIEIGHQSTEALLIIM